MKRNTKPAPCLSVLGTASDVGKSVVVTALCRILSDLGVRVAPFKAQNMSNNSYVTLDGGEMGRAQIVQAEAARAEPHVDMNPVLLKPAGDTVSQVVLHGKPLGNRKAGEYFKDTQHLFDEARTSLDRLRGEYDLIVMEGAGSCAEVNLARRDFVNFRMARAAGAPVVLVADIDRGGVFAQIVGTLEVLPAEDRDLVRGFVVNRFRGDATLFRDGIEYIERRTGLPVLGLIPFYRDIEIDCEDGVPLEAMLDPPAGPAADRISCAVLRLPHISNFTDFAPLARERIVSLHYLAAPRPLCGYDIVFLPGTKNARADAEWLTGCGWGRLLSEYTEAGGRIGGICGGYQVLGKVIRDPHGIEGPPGETRGLGLLDVETTLEREKILRRRSGVWIDGGERVDGYEIHMGVTRREGGLSATVRLTADGGGAEEEDGAQTSGGRIWGTYLHGLFDLPRFRRSFLAGLRPDLIEGEQGPAAVPASAFRDRQYDLLAAHFKEHLDVARLISIIDPEGELAIGRRATGGDR